MRVQQLLTAALLMTGACSIADLESPLPEPDSFRCATEAGAALIGLEEVTLCGNDVTLRGAAGVDVFSNKYIHISGSAFVQGDIILPVGGVFDVNPSSLVSDSAMRNFGEAIVAAPRTLEVAELVLANDNARLDPLLIHDGTHLSVLGGQAVIPAGTYYFTSVAVAGAAELVLQGDVRIFVDGGVTFSGTTSTNQGGDFKLELISVSTARVNLSGTTDARLHISAPLAPVSISGDTKFRGTVLGRKIVVSGYVTVEALGDASNYDADSCLPEPDAEPCGDDLPPAGGPHMPDDAGTPDSDPL